jgi:hypothetical protein
MKFFVNQRECGGYIPLKATTETKIEQESESKT